MNMILINLNKYIFIILLILNFNIQINYSWFLKINQNLKSSYLGLLF